MIHKEIEQRDVNVIVDITCDVCGNSCKDINTPNYEYVEMEVNWGYGSKNDGERWTAQVCENCTLTKLNFINFKKRDYSLGTSYSTEEEIDERLEQHLLKYKLEKDIE